MKLELDLKEKYNEGIEKGRADEREECINKLIEALRELNIDEEIIIKKLELTYNLSKEQSKEYLNKNN